MSESQEMQINCTIRKAEAPEHRDLCCCVRKDQSEDEALCHEVTEDCC
jgi:hypothetical protein